MTETRNYSLDVEVKTDPETAKDIADTEAGRLSPEDEADIKNNDIDGPGEQVKVHTVLGKKFGMKNSVARGAFLVRDFDTRYTELAETRTLEEFYVAGMEWAFQEHLKGNKLTEDMWTDIFKWMREYLQEEFPGLNETYINTDGSIDEYFLISLFGQVLFFDLKKLLILS